MRVAYITAGAAGMYCGSCIRDNALAAALQRLGTEVALIPTYTPLRTDDANVSMGRIFYGGINVYLQQKAAIFRHTPWMLDRLFDRPTLLNGLSRFSPSTRAEDLGALTVSVLKGEEGRQRKELAKLIGWLGDDYGPDVVQLTNSMFAGMAREIKKSLGVPVLCALQGEDLFLQQLVEPYRSQAMEILRRRCQDVDGFVAPCRYYADFMADFLGISPGRIRVVELGVNLQGHGEDRKDLSGSAFCVGYLARICPEKGLHLLVEAFHRLSRRLGPGSIKLKIAGYLGERDRPYFEGLMGRIDAWGMRAEVEYRGAVDRRGKIEFLNGLHVLSVPTVYEEPKGLFILEALANGVPVVQPSHGAFPELIEATGGGLLVRPGSAEAVAAAIDELMIDAELRERLARRGKDAVHRRFGDEVMAAATLDLYREFLSQCPAAEAG